MGGRLTGTRTEWRGDWRVSCFQVGIIGEFCPQFTNVARQHGCSRMRDVSQVHKLGDSNCFRADLAAKVTEICPDLTPL